MTLFAETSPRISYLGNGVAVDFAYPFRVLEEEELAVYVDGDRKGLGSHYSVTGIDDATGGTVTFFTAPPNLSLVLLQRDMPLTQPVDLREHDALSAETQEREYDRLTMLIQWQEDQHAHMLRLSDLSPTILPQGSLPEPEVGKFLRWHDPTHLDNASVVSAGTLSISGDVAGRAAFWVAPQALGGDDGFYWDPSRRGLKLARGMHEGATSLLPHKDGPLHVFLKNSDNVNGYNGILVHLHNGAPTDTLSTLGNDKVAVAGWTKRGPGGSSPIYGGNFGIVYDSPGVANGVEIDAQNNSGVDGHGQGLWVNGSGSNHRSNAILIDTQDTSKWRNGIMFTHNAGGGATGNVTNVGILFDHNQSQDHIRIVPFDDLNPNNYVFELRDSTFIDVKAGISKRGQFVGRASSTGFNQPTFSFVDDQRTGMYSPALNELAFSTIGFPRMKMNSTGDVYIFGLVGSGTAGVSVEADGRLIRGAGGGGGGGAITSPLVVSGAAAGELRLLELPANGTDYVGFKAPDILATPRIWTLPAIDGTNGQVLTTNGALALSWTTPSGSGSGAVTSVGGLAGVIGITNDVNVQMTSTSPNLVLGWSGTLATSRGGTGTGGAPSGQVAIWTAGGVSGDAALQWDNAVGGKRLTVGQPNALASPSKVLTAAGRSTGGSDPVLQVYAAFAGASPTLNHPVPATFVGDFLGGAAMPVGFGSTIEFGLHDYAGAGTYIPAAYIDTTLQVLSPPTTSLTFGTQVAGAATPLLSLDTGRALFGRHVVASVASSISAAGANLTAARDYQGAPPAVNDAVGNLIFTHAGTGFPPSTIAQIIGTVDGSGAFLSGRLTVHTHNGTTLVERMRINASGVTNITGTLTVNGGAVITGVGSPGVNQFAFFSGTTSTISSSPNYVFNAGTGVVSLIAPGSLQIGTAPLGAQAPGPLQVTSNNADNANPYQSILAQMVNGTAGVIPTTIANDHAAVSGWAFRGTGGSSPIYGGHFGVKFDNTGVSNGVEIGVQNFSGTNTVGNGLWVNGSGSNTRDNAILIDTQNVSKWNAGIRFTEGFVGGGATGSIAQFGIIFDKSQDADFIVIRPRVGAGNAAIRITDSTFATNKFVLTNDGSMALGPVGIFGGAGSLNVAGGINAAGNIGGNQYFSLASPGFGTPGTGTAVTVRNAAGTGVSTLTIAGGIIIGWTP